MSFTSSNIVFTYSQYTPESYDGKSGGSQTSSEIPAYVAGSGVRQLFNVAMMQVLVMTQYHKVFIKNNSAYTATGVKLCGFNAHDKVVHIAVERGQDGEFVLNGDEQVKNMVTVPRRYVRYEFDEYQAIDYITLPDIPAGSAIGVWLKFETGTIGSNNLEDYFTLGIEMTADSSTVTKTINLYHSRIDGEVNIINISKSKLKKNGYAIKFEMIDLESIGIAKEDIIYGIYVDKIKIQEHVGTDRVYVSLYGNSVPYLVEMYAIPYKGYETTLPIGICNLPIWDDTATWNDEHVWVDEKTWYLFNNRLNLEFLAKNTDIQDVVKHVVKWKKDSDLTYKDLCHIDAITGIGSGTYVNFTERIET